MPYVKIAYDPDLSKIGDVVDVSDEEAAGLISSGHARLTRKPAGETPKKTPAKKAASKKPANELEAGPTSGAELGENGVTAVAEDPVPTD